jgi:DNA-binding transcriptional MerR regulator/DNA gyrase inhibitor GyrI
MDQLISINQVTAQLNISSRMLRHWESSGLFRSVRDAQSNWRAYDGPTLQRIRTVLLLRRLGIAIKDIREILEAGTVSAVCGVLSKYLHRLNKIASGIDSHKKAISAMLDYLRQIPEMDIASFERALLPLVDDRANAAINEFKEAYGMYNNSVKNNEVRFVVLPPMRTAAYSCVDSAPEDKAMAPVLRWIRETGLLGTMRLFGYNTEPYPSGASPEYGFGFCATIPEGIPIPDPLAERRLPGGLYAVMNSTEDVGGSWNELVEIIRNNESYEMDARPCLEEHFRNTNRQGSGSEYSLTLLLAVKERK